MFLLQLALESVITGEIKDNAALKLITPESNLK